MLVLFHCFRNSHNRICYLLVHLGDLSLSPLLYLPTLPVLFYAPLRRTFQYDALVDRNFLRPAQFEWFEHPSLSTRLGKPERRPTRRPLHRGSRFNLEQKLGVISSAESLDLFRPEHLMFIRFS